MLSTDNIVRVVLNLTTASASPSSFDTGLILAPLSSGFTDAKRYRIYSSAEGAAVGLTTDGFAASSEAYKAAMKYFGAEPKPSRLLFSAYPSSESVSQALDALLEITSSFYGVYPVGVSSVSDLIPFVQHVQGVGKPMMLFLPATGTVAQVTASSALMASLQEMNTRRAIVSYVNYVEDAAAIMGTAMGLQLAHPSSAFSLCYKTITGISTLNLTETNVETVKQLNGNVYIIRGNNHFLYELGSTASGARYDEVMYLDMIADALKNAAVTMLADNPNKLPQTDDTSAAFINRFSAILSQYSEMGVIATGLWRSSAVGPLETGDAVENGFLLWADSYDNQSDADRAAHKAMPIHAALVPSGSVETMVISINVSL